MAVIGLAALAGAMSWFGFAYSTVFSPSGVGDPALVFGTVMGPWRALPDYLAASAQRIGKASVPMS